MTRTLTRLGWLGSLGLAWLLTPAAASAWGPNTPIPISTNSVFVYRFDVKIGPSAFARPAGPWYSYFPVDPNLLAQPRATAFPTWPTQFPPQAPPMSAPPEGLTYYRPMPGNPYAYGSGIYPAGYYAPQPMPSYWYQR